MPTCPTTPPPSTCTRAARRRRAAGSSSPNTPRPRPSTPHWPRPACSTSWPSRRASLMFRPSACTPRPACVRAAARSTANRAPARVARASAPTSRAVVCRSSKRAALPLPSTLTTIWMWASSWITASPATWCASTPNRHAASSICSPIPAPPPAMRQTAASRKL